MGHTKLLEDRARLVCIAWTFPVPDEEWVGLFHKLHDNEVGRSGTSRPSHRVSSLQ